MFSTKQNQMINQESQFSAKQDMLTKSIARQHREKIKRRMRQMNAMTIIPFKGVKLNQFLSEVENNCNPYCLALTMFQIAQQINWRSYAPYLQAVIRTFHNLCNADISVVTVLTQIQNFQSRLANMMYLGDTTLLGHLKLLIIFLLKCNIKFRFINEEGLSEHILWMYRQGIDIFWLLARIKVSPTTIDKLFKAKIQDRHLLPVLTIIGNFIVQATHEKVFQFVKKIEFQNLIQKGLCTQIYEIVRQTIFLVNNVLCKNQQTYIYMVSQTNLVNTILSTENEETAIFKQLLVLK